MLAVKKNIEARETKPRHFSLKVTFCIDLVSVLPFASNILFCLPVSTCRVFSLSLLPSLSF